MSIVPKACCVLCVCVRRVHIEGVCKESSVHVHVGIESMSVSVMHKHHAKWDLLGQLAFFDPASRSTYAAEKSVLIKPAQSTGLDRESPRRRSGMSWEIFQRTGT